MKNAKNFLSKMMKIEECKHKIQQIFEKYSSEELENEDLSIDDLKSLIIVVEDIIMLNAQINIVDEGMLMCQIGLKRILTKKQNDGIHIQNR